MPTTAFDITKAAKIYKVFAVYTPTGGSPVTFVGKMSNIHAATTIFAREIPDANGVLRADSHFAQSAEEYVDLTDIEEIDALLSALGGLTGLSRGTVQMFFCDARDAVNTVRYLTDAWACAVLRDGDIKTGDTNSVSKNPTLRFLSEKSGPITFTPNGTTA
ncbi:MAG: hypothetical protein KGL39_48425 [Patescibacteria group bacterium]|nr:hypothetical protein [Patescibacteria group bacterium]